MKACTQASTASVGVSMEVAEAFMEAIEASMEAVEASTEAFMNFHAKNKCRKPLNKVTHEPRE